MTSFLPALLLMSTSVWAQDPPEVDDEPAPQADEALDTNAERSEEGPEAPEEDVIKPPLPEADFFPRDIELKFRLGFNGASPGPFTLFTSLGGWSEFGLSVDAGMRHWRDFTIGLGGTVWYGQAGILGAAIQRIANTEDHQFRWDMWESGGTFRATFHYTALASLDPYLFGGIGGGAFQLTTRRVGWTDSGFEKHLSGYLRLEAGGGLVGRIKGGDWVIGGELRYLVAIEFQGTDELTLQRGDESATFVLFPQHGPSRGFSWVIQAGYRF